jgi:dUTPase
VLLNQQEKEEVILLAGVIDPDYQGRITLFLQTRWKEECVWDTGDSLEHLLVLL